MSISRIVTTTDTSPSTFICDKENTYIYEEISKIKTIICSNKCVNLYLPVWFQNRLIYICSNSNSKVNVYLPIEDGSNYKYTSAISLNVSMYLYIQYSFNRLPILSISPSIFPGNMGLIVCNFTIDKNLNVFPTNMTSYFKADLDNDDPINTAKLRIYPQNGPNGDINLQSGGNYTYVYMNFNVSDSYGPPLGTTGYDIVRTIRDFTGPSASIYVTFPMNLYEVPTPPLVPIFQRRTTPYTDEEIDKIFPLLVTIAIAPI